jgi:hypothetical protein
MTGEPEHATDVTDLHDAQRLIAELHRQVAHLQTLVVDLEEQSHPVAGEFTAFLDSKHTDMLELLYQQRKLFDDQDEEWDQIEAFSEFVTGWLDVQWDSVRLDQESTWLSLDDITPSA